MRVRWPGGCGGVVASLLLVGAVASTPAQESGERLGVRGALIPTGFDKGRYSALIQVAVDGSPLPDATWDLTASVASAGRSPQDFSGRIVAGEPWTPAVMEIRTSLRPGEFAVDLKAAEATGGQSATARLVGNLPDPSLSLASVSPVAIVQPAEAAFLRDKKARQRGAIARGRDEPVRPDLPAAMICVVCRRPGQRGTLLVERSLAGASSSRFDAIELGADTMCAQVRDLIQPGSLTEGTHRYRVRILASGVAVAEGEREFRAVAGARPPRGPAE